MRVLFWTELFWPEIGGLELFGMQLISALRRRGHEFAVVAALHRADAEPELSYEGVPVFRFPFQHALIRRDLRAVHTLVEQSAEIKRRWKPDVIHLNSIGSSMFFYERAQARMAAPAVFTLHSPFLAEGDPDSLLGRVLATAQWVTGVSRSTLDRALRVAPAIAPRASVVL
ncbi:MAG: glycosyltransferase, partial [Candidatus Hydrogenedentes bacterium]|nr:glycosyltransferase [Candidatus Hydrogenedentota bacterium]